MASLPSYVAAAQPVPKDKRVPWFKTTAKPTRESCSGSCSGKSVPSSGAPGSARHFGPWDWSGNSWGGNRGPDLPLPLLSRARTDGNENGPAAGGRWHFHVRCARRLSYARLLDGRFAVRLVGGQCVFLLRASRRALSATRRCRTLHLAIGTVWAIVAALVGLKGINYVAKVATYLPLIPLVIL